VNDGAPAKATALDVAAHLLTLKPDVTCAGLTPHGGGLIRDGQRHLPHPDARTFGPKVTALASA